MNPVVWLQSVPIEDGPLLTGVYATAAAALLVLLVPRLGVRGAGVVRAGWSAAAAGAGAALGALAVWVSVDLLDAFGAPASTVIRAAATGAGAAAGIAVVNLVRTAWWRRAVALLALVGALVSGALMINRDVAYYPTLGAAFGDTGVQPLRVDRVVSSAPSASPPTVGTLGTVRIAGRVSHFRARDAWVYLPPATAEQPRRSLPVVIAFSGQPGSPSDVFLAGGLQTRLDAIAARNGGRAPIVVVPDQLGAYSSNPMCVDSPLGRVATYITVDVRRWVLDHVPAAARDRAHWAVGGFSEGGTCAAQFGASHPELFGGVIAVSPEWGPLDHTVARTVAEAFHGDAAAWRAAHPIAMMRKHGRYHGITAIYSVGALDHRYGRVAPAMAAAARHVGIHATFERIPGLAHNWNTGAAGLDLGLQRLLPTWGLR